MSTPPFAADPGGQRLDDVVLGALFSQQPVGLQVLDTHLRLVRVNSAGRLLPQFPVDRMLGQPLGAVLRAFEVEDRERVESMARRVLETGEPSIDLRVRMRGGLLAEEFVVSVACFRLQDADGTVLGLATAIVDVTERSRAQARLRMLNAASTGIGTTLDVFRTADELCGVAVPKLADSVAVDVLDSVLRGQAPAPGATVAGLPLRRAGFRSVAADSRQGAPSVGEVSTYPAGTPYRQVLASLEPCLVRELDTDSAWLDLDRGRGARLRAAGAHSLMVVPVCARGVVLGLVTFYRWRTPAPFGPEDLDLAQQLAARTALCLDNARLYNREHSVARILQLGLRPPEPPVHTAVETAHTYLPAGSGGGWFDVIALSGARVALAVGGTTGHDLHAAAAMGELRAAVAALSDLDLPPEEILERLHNLAARAPHETRASTEDRPLDQVWPATCLYTVYDPVTRTLTAARAGHPSPVVLHPNGDAELLDIPPGPPLGQGHAEYAATQHTLPEGSILVLYNEALIHGGDPALRLPLDLARLAAPPAQSSLQETCDTIAQAVAPAQPHEDAILLLARTHALGADHTAGWTLPNAPDVVAEARRLATAQLTTWNLEDLQDTTALIVSELVTNAIRYAKGPIGLRLILDRTMVCEVTDDSSTAPQLRRAHDSDEGGRGLYITAQLTERWGTRPGHRGKTIWAEQTLPHPAPADAHTIP